jgi:hypothetical protein
MERVGDREGKMERYCSTGQSPLRAVAPTEDEEEFVFYLASLQRTPNLSWYEIS